MLHGPRSTQHKARALRRRMSLPEVMLWLWQVLRRAPAGLRFRRQHPAGPYVLDFYCATRKLAIEVDGAVHRAVQQWQHDVARDAWLSGHGIMVLRLPAADILLNVNQAADAIVTTALARPDTRSP